MSRGRFFVSDQEKLRLESDQEKLRRRGAAEPRPAAGLRDDWGVSTAGLCGGLEKRGLERRLEQHGFVRKRFSRLGAHSAADRSRSAEEAAAATAAATAALEAETLLAPLFDEARTGTALLHSLAHAPPPGAEACLRAGVRREGLRCESELAFIALEAQRDLLLQEQQLLRDMQRELMEQCNEMERASSSSEGGHAGCAAAPAAA